MATMATKRKRKKIRPCDVIVYTEYGSSAGTSAYFDFDQNVDIGCGSMTFEPYKMTINRTYRDDNGNTEHVEFLELDEALRYAAEHYMRFADRRGS